MSGIPNSAPWITDLEVEAVASMLRRGRIASNEENLGPAKDALRRFVAGQPVLLTTSCTTAMELAFSALEFKPGDEVLVPSFTFVSTANAILQAGGRPVFVDIEDQTLNIDPALLATSTTPRTRALAPVHYNGVSCDMDLLMAFATEHKLHVVEDAAHALGAKYRSCPLGTIGDFGCFSFHDTKNIVCGEGGAVVLNNPAYREKAEWMYDKGTNRSQFLRGEIDKYTWVSRGSSYLMSGVLAALLKVQLDRYDEMRAARQKIMQTYEAGLKKLVDDGHLRFPDVPSYSVRPYHIACVLIQDQSRRDPLLTFLKDRGIGALFHYLPLHLSPYALKELGTKPGQCPVTERVAASLVRLPLFPHLPLSDAEIVIDAVTEFFHPHSAKAAAKDIAYGTASARGSQALDLSLVIACYNEAPHLHRNLDVILSILDELGRTYELILIDDCSTDASPDRIREYIVRHPHHRIRAVFHAKNAGRGSTVAEGMRMAHGHMVGFIDIDLEVHARYIPSALVPLEKGQADIVIADRVYRFQLFAWQRYLMSRGYRSLVQWMLKTPSIDTESGFKFFRRDAILPILDRVRDPHWFWDTEVTIRSLDAGLRIASEPVLFARDQAKLSTVKAFRDSWRMLKNLFAFRRERMQKRRSSKP